MENQITTPAPLPVDVLKQVFQNPDSLNITLEVDKSALKPNVLLAYITNLGLNVTLHFDETEVFFECIRAYMKSVMFHRIPQLELGTLDLLLQVKGYPTTTGIDYTYLIDDVDFQPTIERWLTICESLSVYGIRWFNITERVAGYWETFPVEESNDLEGINFVNLIKYGQFPLVVQQNDPSVLKYHKHLYDDPIYQGATLAAYWNTEENILFILNQVMVNRLLDPQEFEHNFELSVDNLSEELNEAPI